MNYLRGGGETVYAVIYVPPGVNVSLDPKRSNGCYAYRQGEELVHRPERRPETERAETGRQVACMAFYGPVYVLLEYLRGLGKGKVRVLPRCGGKEQPSCMNQ
ncbi:MAG: hypothetical protein QXY45_00110 [Candidatus Aenigmatarchaeota archaeon]